MDADINTIDTNLKALNKVGTHTVVIRILRLSEYSSEIISVISHILLAQKNPLLVFLEVVELRRKKEQLGKQRTLLQNELKQASCGE